MPSPTHRSQEDWVAIIQQFRTSGLSARAFCKKLKISESYFSLLQKKHSRPVKSRPAFVKAVVPAPGPTQALASANAPAIQILKGDVFIGIQGHSDPFWLAKFVRELCQ
jgi:hypothetical protein